ncbi:MAG: ATP-binding protein [Candidatus Bathyarchaeota archaeon]
MNTISRCIKLRKSGLESEMRKSMGDVTMSIVHDIRNLLQAIRNAAYAIKNDIGDKYEMSDLIDNNLVASDRILQNLTDFSVHTLKISETDINMLIKEALAQTVLTRHIKLKTSFGEIAPAKVDPNQLSRVFQNIVLNSLQSMHKAGELRLVTEQKDSQIRITVTDTGVGISQENIKKLFNPFFTTKSKGTGLGLANAKRVIENHHGKITLKSKEGQGTTVTIQLPIMQ